MLSINKLKAERNFKSSQEILSPDCFRDDELFDETSDIEHMGYRIYDKNDLPLSSHKSLPVANDYLEYYNYTTKPKYNIDTSPILNTFDRLNETESTAFFRAGTSKLESLKKISYLRKKDEIVFSNKLYNYLKKAYENHPSARDYFSVRELKDLCKVCKLKYTDNSEYVDYEMLEAGLHWLKKCPSNDNSHAIRILKAFVVKNKNNKEIFLKKANSFFIMETKNYNEKTPEKCEKMMAQALKKDSSGSLYFDPNAALEAL